MNLIHVTTMIFGGGVAGLWLLDELRRAGYSAILADVGRLGQGQTLASQGILHSGLKYSLAGILTPSAREARLMPALWRKCLRGEAEPNLAGTKIVSESFLLWGTDSTSSRLGMLGAKLGLQVTPQAVPASDRPAVLRGCAGPLYRVDEQVISPASLVTTLAEANRASIVQIDRNAGVEFDAATDGTPRRLRLRSPDGDAEIDITADWIILTAGKGNARLRKQLGLSNSAMQTRPLHMVLVRGELPDFFGHCVDGARTRVSITSARDSSGRVVWQVGGQIAEDGVSLDSETLIARAQAEMCSVMPGLRLVGTEWTTYRVDRAEGATATGGRPESFRLLHEGNILTAWPTKLVLAPQLAQAMLAKIESSSPTIAPTTSDGMHALRAWPRPTAGAPPWEHPQAWVQYAAPHRAAA